MPSLSWGLLSKNTRTKGTLIINWLLGNLVYKAMNIRGTAAADGHIVATQALEEYDALFRPAPTKNSHYRLSW